MLDTPERRSTSSSGLLIERTTRSKSSRQVRRHLERPITILALAHRDNDSIEVGAPGKAPSGKAHNHLPCERSLLRGAVSPQCRDFLLAEHFTGPCQCPRTSEPTQEGGRGRICGRRHPLPRGFASRAVLLLSPPRTWAPRPRCPPAPGAPAVPARGALPPPGVPGE